MRGQEAKRGPLGLTGDSPTSLGTVHVGGAVRKPVVIDIGSDGLTLGQVLVQVPVTPFDVKSIEHETDPEERELLLAWGSNRFVSLQRSVLGIQQFRYYPIESVRQDIVGQIPMKNGDVVRIVSAGDTGLRASRDITPGESFTVSGMVARNVQLPIDVVKYSTLGDVIDNTPGEFELANNPSMIVLARPASSGLALNHYMIDMKSSWIRTIMSDVPLLAGDQIVFSDLSQTPLIRDSLVSAIQRDRQLQVPSTDEQGEILSNVTERAGEIPAVKTVRQLGQNLWSRLPSFR